MLLSGGDGQRVDKELAGSSNDDGAKICLVQK